MKIHLFIKKNKKRFREDKKMKKIILEEKKLREKFKRNFYLGIMRWG